MHNIINTIPLHLCCETEYQHHTHETCDERIFTEKILVKIKIKKYLLTSIIKRMTIKINIFYFKLKNLK